MKLLIATDGLLPRWDGIASFVNELVPRLSKQFAITIIGPDFGETPQYDAQVIKFPIIKVRLADNYYASNIHFKQLIREIKQADVVFAQCLGPIGIWATLIARIYKKPVAMYNHMLEWEVFPKSQGIDLLKLPINVITKWFARFMYNRCSTIIVPNMEHADLLRVSGIYADKKIVPLGVDAKHYVPTKNKADAKQKIGLDPNHFIVGYAGRVSLEKNLITLYRAFMRLHRKYPNTHLLIAGGGRQSVEKLFLNKKHITLTGLQNDLLPYYQAMDVYVLPSLVETTSLTTMEAMSTGLAVVATPVGFVKEYLNEGVNGLFFPKKNSYQLFKHLEYLKSNKQLRLELGKNARDTITSQYTWDLTAHNIAKVIEGLVMV